MMGFLKLFRRNDSGMTTIEYALLTGVMGAGVLASASYMKNELTSFVSQQVGCTWVAAEVDENGDDGAQRCVYGNNGRTSRRSESSQ